MYTIKRFFNRVVRLFQYIPVIWHTEDYDYMYALDIFKYQLKRTGQYVEDADRILSSRLVNAKIKTAIDILDKAYSDHYINEPYKILERQYGKCEFDFREIEGTGNYEFMDLKWEGAVDAEHNQEINDLLRAMEVQAQQKQERAKKLAWQYIHQNIETWWD